MKHKMHFFSLLICLLSALSITQAKAENTRGFFDFKNPQYNAVLLADLDEPALFSLFRYSDEQHLNSEIRILLEIDGRLVEEELLGGGNKFSALESDAVAYLYGKSIKIVTDPSQYDRKFTLKGEYSNNALNGHKLISEMWTLVTKPNEHIQRTIVHIGSWKKPINIRINFSVVEVEGNNNKNNLLCMLYLDGKPFVDSHGTPYIFSDGNSVDVTAKSVSIGFHPGVDDSFKGRIKGTFNIREIDLQD